MNLRTCCEREADRLRAERAALRAELARCRDALADHAATLRAGRWETIADRLDALARDCDAALGAGGGDS